MDQQSFFFSKFKLISKILTLVFCFFAVSTNSASASKRPRSEESLCDENPKKLAKHMPLMRAEIFIPNELIKYILSFTDRNSFIPAALVSKRWLSISLSRANEFSPSVPINNRLTTHRDFLDYWSTERIDILFGNNRNNVPSLEQEIFSINPLIATYCVQQISEDGQRLIINGHLNYDNKKTLSFVRTPGGLKQLHFTENGTYTKAESFHDADTTIVGTAWNDQDRTLGCATKWKNEKALPLSVPEGTRESQALHASMNNEFIVGSLTEENKKTFVRWKDECRTPLLEITPMRPCWDSSGQEETWNEEAEATGLSEDGRRVIFNYMLEDAEYNLIKRHAILSIDDSAGPRSLILGTLNGAADRWATGISADGKWVCGIAEDGLPCGVGENDIKTGMTNVRWYENGSIHPLEPRISQSFGCGCIINYDGTVIAGDLMGRETAKTSSIWIAGKGYYHIKQIMHELNPDLIVSDVRIINLSRNGRQLIGQISDCGSIFRLTLPVRLFK